MQNQDTNQSRDDRDPIESSFDLAKFWEGLGSGGRTLAGLFFIFAVFAFIGNSGNGSWVEIPFAEGEAQQQAQFVETLRGEQVEYRFTPEGQIEVAKGNVGKVLALIQGVAGYSATEDPFEWVRNSDSILGNTRQREQRWERSHIQKLEEDLARLDGVFSVSVTPSSATANAVIGSARKVNGVSVQVLLDEDIREEGLSQEVARAIGLHVSGAYAVTLDKIVLTDTFGHYYDLMNPKVTSGDVASKKKKVEGYVSRYLGSFFSEDMFRITVDVSLAEEVENIRYTKNGFPVVHGVQKIQEQVASLTTTSSQFADTVVARAIVQQVPSYDDSDPTVNSVEGVAITVMLDRENALAIASSRYDGSTGQGFNNAAISQRSSAEMTEVLRGFTREVANGIESHLKVHLGTGTQVDARVFPVTFGGIGAAVTTAIPFVSGPEGQKNSFPFYFLVFFGIVFTFVMLRDGPVDAPREAAIQGFGVKSNVSPAIGIQQAIQTYVKEENQVSYEQSIQIIRNLTVDESVLILRHVVSETRAVLPGSDILALLILDQGGKRDAIFQKLESDELAILGEVIETAGVVDVESVEDAMAALDLFKGTDNEFSSGISLPSFVSTVSNQADVNQTVLEDIRATDPDLAELIERNRQGSTSQEVQSS